MNEQRRSRIRKMIYLALIAFLLIPVAYLSRPATTKEFGGHTIKEPGGQLAQFRDKHHLSQASLGEIDPASETIKLATLGLRGVAANILWEKANYYKKVEDWTALSATLEQIARLQPNFISVWQFQGWNLSFNVAVEFDDYRQRYQWIIKGINFLKEGTDYNTQEPRLLWDIGWFISHKIGRADERVLYRQLFRKDDDFHDKDNPTRPKSERDNWKVGMEWFAKAEHLVDDLGIPIKGRSPVGPKEGSPLVFHSTRPMCQINHADAQEEDGVFGEKAQHEWKLGGEEWFKYGRRDLMTTYNIIINLNDQERFEKEAAEATKELEELAPGAYEKILRERIAQLPAEEQEIARLPKEKRTPAQLQKGYTIDGKVKPNHFDVAEKASAQNKSRALKAAKTAAEAEEMAGIIDRHRDVVNFLYWRRRCEMESDDATSAARKSIHQADEAFEAADLPQAGKFFDEGIAQWRKVLDKYPDLAVETTTNDEVYRMIDRYADYLGRADYHGQKSQTFPEDFILLDVMKTWQATHRQDPPLPHVPLIPEIMYPGADLKTLNIDRSRILHIQDKEAPPAQPDAEPKKDEPNADAPATDKPKADGDHQPGAEAKTSPDARPETAKLEPAKPADTKPADAPPTATDK